MALAKEPALFQYFMFLVKQKGSLNVFAINEAQELWNKLCEFFKLKNDTPLLYDTIKNSNNEIFYDKNVKQLTVVKGDDRLVMGEQVLAHDMVTICFIINKHDNYETDTPEKDWDELTDFIDISRDLNYIYGSATVLQTITKEHDKIASSVKNNFPIYNSKNPISCGLEFGTLWQYGSENKFLLTVNEDYEEAANRFLTYNFAYIVTLFSKIERHYELAVKLYEESTKQESLMNELSGNIESLPHNNEITVLNKKLNEVRSLDSEVVNNISYLRDCGNNIKSNLINFKDSLKNFCTEGETEQLFANNIELFEEHLQNINSWVSVCESSLIRINNASDTIQKAIKEKIEDIRTTLGEAGMVSETASDQRESEVTIEWGSNYIVDESDLEKSLKIFESLVEPNRPGICITRTHPDKIRKTSKLDNITVYWLSNTFSDDYLPPSPSKIMHLLMQYIKSNEHSIILFDGLEFVVTYNDYNKVLKLVDSLKELVQLHNSILIIPLSYIALSEKEITLIKKNMIDISNANIDIEMLK